MTDTHSAHWVITTGPKRRPLRAVAPSIGFLAGLGMCAVRREVEMVNRVWHEVLERMRGTK
jgi:hypothetical protein